ncbi:hypothetical protein SE17_18660, partial [Kouleothrix aurantiaca]
MRAIIAGAGPAGFATAKWLNDRGYEVVLLEKRAVPGGKVSAWRDADGDWVESGLHVFFGAYHNLLNFLAECGLHDSFDWTPAAMVFLAPGHSPFDLPHNPKLTPENNPYLGLRAFTENEHTLFFGRSSETNYLMLVVRTTPLTIVSGPTGSGKTSLVLAGLLPQLRADTDTPRTILTPVAFGENPFDQLAALDLPAAEKESFLGRVAARWTNDRGPLSARIDAWVSANPGKQLVLVLDQLEALCANNQPGSQAGDAATDLAEALSKHADILRVVGIIRSDALDLFSKVHLTNDSPLTAHWKPENIVPVSGSVSTDRLREMIVGPASERVLFFENDALVNQIANSVAGNPGALPVLSLVLSATYLNYIKRVPIDRTIIT